MARTSKPSSSRIPAWIAHRARSRLCRSPHAPCDRVAYRLALDHPRAVTHVILLDIVPTAEVCAAENAAAAMSAFHWYLLAQPRPFPETMIAADPEAVVRHLLRAWAGKGFAFDPANLADYIECFSDPASIHATCRGLPRRLDLRPRSGRVGRGWRRIQTPLLVLWGRDYSVA